MDREKAAKIIEERIENAEAQGWGKSVPEYIEALVTAVDALRKIDDLEELRMPEAVVLIAPAGCQAECWECPNCGDLLTQEDVIAGNCKWCGQSIGFPGE